MAGRKVKKSTSGAKSQTRKPLMIAVTSGKGGVGKTRIALALACEFALKFKTLLIDLDFFNRGLRGLMPKSVNITPIETPQILLEGTKGKTVKRGSGGGQNKTHIEDKWHIHNVKSSISGDNFHFLHYPDLTEGQVMAFVSSDLDDLQKAISSIVKSSVSKCGIEVVILDCHGGPDNTSFAACLEADLTLLVAEPETASLNGTFNFIRQLEYAAPGKKPSIRLVFNKVKLGTSFKFLNLLSETYITKRMGGKELLAAFPFEPKLDRFANEEGLFPYLLPNSLMVRKTKALLVDLGGEPRFKPYVKQLPILQNKYITFLRRRSMRDIPKFLNSVFYLKSLAYFGSVSLVYFWLLEKEFLVYTDFLSVVEILGIVVLYFALGMLIISLWIQLSADAKTRAIVAARSNQTGRMTLNVLAIGLVWLVPAVFIAFAFDTFYEMDFDNDSGSSYNNVDLGSALFVGILSLVYFSYIGKGVFDVWRGKYEAHTPRERAINFIFVLIFLFLPPVLFYTDPAMFHF